MTLAELRALAIHRDETGATRFDHPYHQMSVSLEEAEFLYALVRATRPRKVLELGTGLGLSGRFIAEALPDGGWLWTIEPMRSLWPNAEGLLLNLPASISQTEEGLDLDPDLVYIDSDSTRRNADIREWLTNGYQGLVLVHDAAREYPEVKLGAGVYLPTADGMWLGRGK